MWRTSVHITNYSKLSNGELGVHNEIIDGNEYEKDGYTATDDCYNENSDIFFL